MILNTWKIMIFQVKNIEILVYMIWPSSLTFSLENMLYISNLHNYLAIMFAELRLKGWVTSLTPKFQGFEGFKKPSLMSIYFAKEHFLVFWRCFRDEKELVVQME